MTYTFPIAAAFPNTTLRREIDRLMMDTIPRRSPGHWHPTVNASEDERGFTFELDLPGVDPAAVEVLAEDGVLSIRGSRVSRESAPGEKGHLSESPSGAFLRRFALPKQADLEGVEASYRLGVLSVRVAKVQPAQPRRVPVTIASEPQGNA